VSGLKRTTKVVKVDAAFPEPAILERAAGIVRSGGLVAFPTETVYGLGADGSSERAVRRIYSAKGRPRTNPVILHVASVEEAAGLWSSLPAAAADLAERFWPGPLTIVLPRSRRVPDAVTAGGPSVGVRMPDHPVARGLIEAAGVAIAAPSANAAGRPSPTDAEHVLQDLDGKVEMILDAGPTGLGVESTVLDLTRRPPRILRPGGITREQLRDVLGEVAAAGEIGGSGPTGGLDHYKPRARVILVRPRGAGGASDRAVREALARAVISEYDEAVAGGRLAGIIGSEECAPLYGDRRVHTVGSRHDPAAVARSLYSALRGYDRMGYDVVVAECFPEEGMGAAVVDRLSAAASEVVDVSIEEASGR